MKLLHGLPHLSTYRAEVGFPRLAEHNISTDRFQNKSDSLKYILSRYNLKPGEGMFIEDQVR